MRKKLLSIAIALSLVFTASCAQYNRWQSPTPMPTNPNQRMNQKGPVAGAESSLVGMDQIQRVKITADQANIKSGCSAGTPTIQKSDKDSTHDVLGKVENWYAVQCPNNKIGFVPNTSCKPVAVETKKPQVTQQNAGAAPQGTAGQSGTQTPNAPTASAKLTAAEQEMLTLINQARSQNNVAPLQADTELANVARLKAQDMIDNNYFSHYSPKYGSPFDMMKSFGISYVQAGENIAGNQNVQAAHNALMNSPGHRANILNPDFTHIGIGIRQGGQYGNMFSQMFVGRPK